MKLENILKVFLTSVFCGLVSACVPITNKFPDKVDVVIDTAQTGMIKGKAVIPKVENNHIYWYGKAGADVEVEGTKFKAVTKSGGGYAIDGLPTGSYNVSAVSNGSYKESWYYSKPELAIVTRQGTAEVPDLKLIPMYSSEEEVLHGKAFLNRDKTAPFIGKLEAYNLGYQLDENTGRFSIMVFGSFLASTTTSSDGSYAFQTSMNSVLLKAGSSKTRFFADENHGTDYSFVDVEGIKEADCYLTNQK